MKTVRVTGMVEARMRVQRMFGNVEAKMGLILVGAARKIKHQMDTVPPLIPQDTKDLDKSWEVVIMRSGSKPVVSAGFTAPYAWFVHEMPSENNWSRPGSGPKFLEVALRSNDEMLSMYVANQCRIILETTK